jgi:hypothetical protein
MDLRGQLHARVNFTRGPGKRPQHPLYRQLGGSWCDHEEFLPLQSLALVLQPVASRFTLLLTHGYYMLILSNIYWLCMSGLPRDVAYTCTPSLLITYLDTNCQVDFAIHICVQSYSATFRAATTPVRPQEGAAWAPELLWTLWHVRQYVADSFIPTEHAVYKHSVQCRYHLHACSCVCACGCLSLLP